MTVEYGASSGVQTDCLRLVEQINHVGIYPELDRTCELFLRMREGVGKDSLRPPLYRINNVPVDGGCMPDVATGLVAERVIDCLF